MKCHDIVTGKEVEAKEYTIFFGKLKRQVLARKEKEITVIEQYGETTAYNWKSMTIDPETRKIQYIIYNLGNKMARICTPETDEERDLVKAIKLGWEIPEEFFETKPYSYWIMENEKVISKVWGNKEW